MSRPLRIQYPDPWYLVMNRGRRGESVFLEKQDSSMFVELLKEVVDMYKVLNRLTEAAAAVPSIWPLEVVNVLLVAERQKRLSESDSVRKYDAVKKGASLCLALIRWLNDLNEYTAL